MQVGIVALDFGGPQAPEELRPFLTSLLHDVLPGPAPIRTVVAPLLARLRARKVQADYERIGWSPLVPTHRRQVAALQEALSPEIGAVVSGMMFTPPTMDQAVSALVEAEVDRVVALPFFPHYSFATTRAAFTFFREALERAGRAELPVHWVTTWFDHPRYLEALANTIRAGVAATPGHGPVHLLFTPHGLPLSYVRRGDPYPDQVRTTVQRVLQHLDWTDPWHIGWQSKVGPARWLRPSTPEVIEQLADEGVERLLFVPVSFVSEHVETLFEIDVQYRGLAEKLGIAHVGRAPALGVEPGFIACLAELVSSAVEQFEVVRCACCGGAQALTAAEGGACSGCGTAWPPFAVPR